jgi:hypothetical protein
VLKIVIARQKRPLQIDISPSELANITMHV